VTGRGSQGGPPRRDVWRGARSDSHGSVPRLEPVSSSVEVEELPTQALTPQARSRVPLAGAIAVLAIGILLAGGFGLLGGKSNVASMTQRPSALVAATSPADAPTATSPGVEPRVTPWVPCLDTGDPIDPPVPQPMLHVNGQPHAGRVERDRAGPEQDTDSDGEDPGDLERVEVPMEAVTQIVMPDSRCALEWYISMKADDDPVPIVLESVANKALDPSIAAQNRFDLVVAPNTGSFDLRGIFLLKDVGIRATWLIHVPELAPPGVHLMAGENEVPTVLGCGAARRLANGYEVNLNPCFGDVEKRPPSPTDLAPGDVLSFTIDGWLPNDISVVCGQLPGNQFLAEADCVPTVELRDSEIVFAVPDEPGGWTPWIATCATPGPSFYNADGEICGIWYANIRVRE